MFPLGTVALPGAVLPLRIFEPRYRQLLADVIAGDGVFGVVLIERGSEVGGGDLRSKVGTLVRIEQHQDLGGGQHGILASGVERIRVVRWLSDDPYPRAEISLWPDEEPATADDDSTGSNDVSRCSNEAELLSIYTSCITNLRRLLATATELGYDVAPSTFDAPDNPVSGSYFLVALTPVGPFDKQQLLTAPSAEDRLPLLASLIVDQLALITGEASAD